MTNFNEMGKTELRAACKAAGIKYGQLTVGGMRDALYAAQGNPEARFPVETVTEGPVQSVDEMASTDEAAALEAVKKEEAAKPTSASTGKGLKIEKDRVEQNGVKRPSIGGMCRAVWDALDAIGTGATAKDVKALAETNGWNPNNASIEFYQWRKFHGITGRQAKAAK